MQSLTNTKSFLHTALLIYIGSSYPFEELGDLTTCIMSSTHNDGLLSKQLDGMWSLDHLEALAGATSLLLGITQLG